MVAQVKRTADALAHAGTIVATAPDLKVPVLPLTTGNLLMRARVLAPAAGIPVRLKIEHAADSSIAVETEAVTTVANDWEELTFDFGDHAEGTPAFDPTATYDRIVIFFNFGTDGATAGEQTFFVDDISVPAP